ncbi:hypothetical protein [Actinotalea subterranea]|uniref:hypothetical protein n=1 Tax=Actinotalea subterranea TaxID=2607497 RepID=UPI0011EE0852|nr:hypothetical protein [Actinotalea subterranea]
MAERGSRRGRRGCLVGVGVRVGVVFVFVFLALLLGLSAAGVPVQPPGAPVMMRGGTQDRINFGLVSVFRVSGTGDAPVAALGVSAFGGSRSAELERWESIVVPWWGQLTAVSLEPFSGDPLQPGPRGSATLIYTPPWWTALVLVLGVGAWVRRPARSRRTDAAVPGLEADAPSVVPPAFEARAHD